jgi:hypothetical protein
MNQHLRDRIIRKLDTLPDERAYQILDFVEFLESKYAERRNPNNAFTRFADTVEDGLRAGRISTSAIAESMNLMNKAMGVLNGVAAAGKTVASDIVATAREAGKTVSDITRNPSRPEDRRSEAAAVPQGAPAQAVPESPFAQADGVPSAGQSGSHPSIPETPAPTKSAAE